MKLILNGLEVECGGRNTVDLEMTVAEAMVLADSLSVCVQRMGGKLERSFGFRLPGLSREVIDAGKAAIYRKHGPPEIS